VLGDVKAALAQADRERFAERLVVVDDQDFGGHVCS
jgi:hypothetical protein